MKKIKMIILFVALCFLCSCDINIGTSNTTVDEGYKTISIYSTNDFHGSIKAIDDETGLLKYGTFFKQKGQEENTLILNAGDMWQGSIESNLNYGEFLTKAMNEIEFDAFTLGNHEFDWGSEHIISNRNLKDEQTEYQTPFLGANIYDYDMTNKVALEQADELCDKYTIKTLENGLKVGIIGIIGDDQITSISSQFVDMYAFIDPIDVIKDLSNDLRKNEWCDVIVVNAHASMSQLLDSSTNPSITRVSGVTNKRYVDAVICAHSHNYENDIYNGVPFIQAGSNGKAYGEIKLKYQNDNVTCTFKSNHNNSVSEITSINEYDEGLLKLYNEYTSISDAKGSEILGSLNGNMYKNNPYAVANIVTKAMANAAEKQGYDIDFTITNTSRYGLDGNEVTYSELYKALPFDNEVYIIYASGSDILNIGSRNFIFNIKNKTIESNKMYLIGVIDYLALHKDSRRNYDYFPSISIVGKLTKDGGLYTYRDITADYIIEIGTINVNDFNGNNNEYQISLNVVFDFKNENIILLINRKENELLL